MPDILEIKLGEKPININTKKLAGVFLADGRCVHEDTVNINGLTLYVNVKQSKGNKPDKVIFCILNPGDVVNKQFKKYIRRKEVLTVSFVDMHNEVTIKANLSKAKLSDSFSRIGRRALIIEGTMESYDEKDSVFPI